MQHFENIGVETRFQVIGLYENRPPCLLVDIPNLLTDNGLGCMAYVWGSQHTAENTPIAAPKTIAVGTGVTLAPAVNQTALEAQVYEKAISPMPATVSANAVTFRMILDYTEPTAPGAQPVVLSEAALFSGSVVGGFERVMISRVLFPTPLPKDQYVQFLLQFTHRFKRV